VAAAPDADTFRLEFEDSLGLNLGPLRQLIETLLASFAADAGGLPGLADLPLQQRAIVSDQVLTAAQATSTNLVEARLHEQDLQRQLAEGSGFPNSAADIERDVRRTMTTVGVFRAVGSSLDCMAAVVIATARIPRSIRRASFMPLLDLNPADAPSEELRPIWESFRELLDAQATANGDWLRWALEMRHALMHRGRQITPALPREVALPPIALPRRVMQAVFHERSRFDPHFRKRPWLPDLEHLSEDSLDLRDAILAEPASRTVRGLVDATDALIVALATWALPVWENAPEGVQSPAAAWQLEKPRDIEFEGFAPEPLPSDLGTLAISQRDEQRLRLAIRLRDHPEE
jgi:hypothetical protein